MHRLIDRSGAWLLSVSGRPALHDDGTATIRALLYREC